MGAHQARLFYFVLTIFYNHVPDPYTRSSEAW